MTPIIATYTRNLSRKEQATIEKYALPLFGIGLLFLLHKFGYQILFQTFQFLALRFREQVSGHDVQIIKYLAKGSIYIINLFLVPLLAYFIYGSKHKANTAFFFIGIVYLLTLLAYVLLKQAGLNSALFVWREFSEYLAQGIAFFIIPALNLVPSEMNSEKHDSKSRKQKLGKSISTF